MPHIVLISASVRIGRKSHRVAMFLYDFIQKNNLATVEMLDLDQLNFPIFKERLKNLPNPEPALIEFSKKVINADGVIIVTPEYNGGYPAALKNVIDLLVDEWVRKPIGLATASDGQFGGTQVSQGVSLALMKLEAIVSPTIFRAPKVQENYSETGVPLNAESAERRAKKFIEDLDWYMERMKE